MNVKLQAMLNAGRWVEVEHGKPALAAVLDKCSERTRERYEAGIAIEWISFAQLMEFYEAVVDVAGQGDRRVLRRTGAASARKNFERLGTRVASWVTSPSFMLKRSASLWRQYNDSGELVLLELSRGHCQMEIRGVPKPHWAFCMSLLGWADELCRAVRWKDPRVRHPECRAEGGKRCVIDVRFRS